MVSEQQKKLAAYRRAKNNMTSNAENKTQKSLLDDFFNSFIKDIKKKVLLTAVNSYLKTYGQPGKILLKNVINLANVLRKNILRKKDIFEEVPELKTLLN